MEVQSQPTVINPNAQHNKENYNQNIEQQQKDLIDKEQDSSSSEKEESEIEFPRDNAQELYQFLHRELNSLQNMEDKQKRKFALIKLYEVFVLAKNKAPNKIYQELLPMIQKQLFKRLSDPVEKVRELAGLIIKEFFARCDDLTVSIPYLMPILTARLNAEDLEGIESLPEQMKPPSVQKPQIMTNTNEPSEEVRVILAEIVTIIVSSTVFECLRAYVDQIVDIIRVLCMDPYGGVIIEGCSAMSEFSQNGADQLLHFSEGMGRSLFTSLINKHAKVRIAGLKALYQVFFCGAFKQSSNLMEHLIGFRDPNVVPIKDFYESTTRLNYFAMLVADRSVQVREQFYKTVASLLMNLPDKKDHEPRMFPYLISGLYDQNTEIQETVFELIEEIGKQYEEEYEKDIRDLKQFGYKPEWMLEGKVMESDLLLPYPFIHRPCLGSRTLVRSYVRRYLSAIYKEVADWIEENRERSSNLLVCSIIYTEDFMTQYLDHLLISLYKAILDKENKIVKKNIPLCFKLLGRYCNPKSYGQFIIPAIRNELASYYPHTQSGALKAFGYIIAGTIEVFPKGCDLSKVDDILSDFVKAINEVILDLLDMELTDHLVETLQTITKILIEKQEQQVDISIIHQYSQDLFFMIIRCLGIYNSFRLMNKQEPDHVTTQKKKCISLLNQMNQITQIQQSDDDYDFFNKNVPFFFNSLFSDQEHLEQVKNWNMQNHKWRMFFVVFDLIDEKQLQYYLNSEATTRVFDKVATILNQILQNGSSKNFPVKSIVIHNLFSILVNKALSFNSSQITGQFLNILKQAALIEWSTKEQTEKELQFLEGIHNDFINCKAVIIAGANLEQFNQTLDGMSKFYKSTQEKTKKDGLQLIMKYITLFYNQMVKDANGTTEKQNNIAKFTVLPKICDDLVKHLTDYYDSVREVAQLVLKFIAEHYMVEEVKLNKEQDKLLHMLKANVSLGWADKMNDQLRDVAKMEVEVLRYIFNDAKEFISTVIKIMIDETHGRDNLISIIKEFNKKTPFLILNDFRLAHNSNSLRRIEVLKELIIN